MASQAPAAAKRISRLEQARSAAIAHVQAKTVEFEAINRQYLQQVSATAAIAERHTSGEILVNNLEARTLAAEDNAVQGRRAVTRINKAGSVKFIRSIEARFLRRSAERLATLATAPVVIKALRSLGRGIEYAETTIASFNEQGRIAEREYGAFVARENGRASKEEREDAQSVREFIAESVSDMNVYMESDIGLILEQFRRFNRGYPGKVQADNANTQMRYIRDLYGNRRSEASLNRRLIRFIVGLYPDSSPSPSVSPPLLQALPLIPSRRPVRRRAPNLTPVLR